MLLRAEARYRTDDKGSLPTGSKGTTSNFAEGVYSVGLLFPFGGIAVRPGTPEDAATAVVDTESADDDNDGVSNDKDQCPGSAAGAVDENGCPVSDSSASSDSTSSEDTVRSEEHTSELQSLMRISYAVFCLKK